MIRIEADALRTNLAVALFARLDARADATQTTVSLRRSLSSDSARRQCGTRCCTATGLGGAQGQATVTARAEDQSEARYARALQAC